VRLVEQLDVGDLADFGVAEPGELLKGQKILRPPQQQPERMRGDIGDLRFGSGFARL